MKVYIAQPMQGIDRASIEFDRDAATDYISKKHGADVEFVNNYNPDWDVDHISPLAALGRALEMLADSDIAYFLPGWEDSRGCAIEADCCTMYGIPMAVIYANDLGRQS